MPELRKVTYTDSEGRKKLVLLPEEASDDEASRGIPLGPPRFEDLGLPIETEVRLNNELFHRGIITASDAVKNRSEVVAAIQAALRVDAGRVVDVYVGREESSGSKESSEEQPNQTVSNRGQSQSRKRPSIPDPYESFGSGLATGRSDPDQNS